MHECVCIYLCIIYAYVCMNACMYVCMYVARQTQVCAYIFPCKDVFIYVDKHA